MKNIEKISKEEWFEIVSTFYDTLPVKMKNYKNRNIFKSMVLDSILLQDLNDEIKETNDILVSLYSFNEKDIATSLNSLVMSLDSYYKWRMNDGRYEETVFGKLREKEPIITFILSYNRPEFNATLNLIEKWNDEEVFNNTFIFVQPEQKLAYEKNHPKFLFYAKSVNSVGERFDAVLDFCKENGIRYANIIEDDIGQICHVKKGGVESGSRLSTRQEDLGGLYFKYLGYKGMQIMQDNSDVVIVGVRNRVMANNESTSIIGYHEPMKGGCPNMLYFIDVEKFYPIWKKIPKEHYSPQYDWAIQCAIVAEKKQWAVITGIVKDEYNSKSVIGFKGDREVLAAEYINYYKVQDSMTFRRFKDTAMQGVKIFFNSRKVVYNYDRLF